MTAGQEPLRIDVLLLEYTHIKEEQRARIGFRDNLIYATVAAGGAVLAAVLQLHEGTRYLLLLPPVYLLLGWTYLVNDEKITAIGRYIRESTAPQVMEITGTSRAVFGWEAAHRSDVHRQSRKRIQLGIDLLAFCVAPMAAVAIYLAYAPHSPLLLVALIEVLATVGLAVQFVRYSASART